ncbi:MAG TPA: hypothetical protein DDY28_04460 [Hyphomonas atlantica]|nr:hypothetical protein [Hyphomonas atlantica]
MIHWLLVAHIIVVGYWLGSELVINSSFRFATRDVASPLEARDRMLQHVMNTDQHVRFALVLQASLGTILLAAYGWVPGGQTLMIAAAVLGVFWLGFVEYIHRVRHSAVGARLAALDRGSRYVLMGVLLLMSIGVIGGDWPIPLWLRFKFAAFAGVIATGVLVRLQLIRFFRVWGEMKTDGVTDARNARVSTLENQASFLIVMIWVFIAIIVALSLFKPV